MYSRLFPWMLFVSLALIAGCEDDVTVDVPGAADFGPPRIVAVGPDYENNEVEIPDGQWWGGGLELWCVVVGEVAAVQLQVDSVFITGIIARPDSGDAGCFRLHVEDLDTLDITPFVPREFPGMEIFMDRSDTKGIFEADPDRLSRWALLQGSQIADLSRVFEEGNRCEETLAPAYLERMLALPPAVPVAQDIGITYIAFDLHGITVTAYGEAGDIVTIGRPDLHVAFTTALEQLVAP